MSHEPIPNFDARFADYKPLMASGAALLEANRCLSCYDAPCIRACPTSIDVPGFIKKIATGNLKGSALKILEANILGASCARACPTEELCEGACVLHDLHEEPIAIGRLQRYATESVVFGQERIFEPAPPNGFRVALVGAGPASLGCAAQLARWGYEVVLFEKSEQPGGLNTYGIADYKMTPSVSLAEIEWVRQLGVDIRCSTQVGEDIAIDALMDEFDAVFLGVGLGGVGPMGMAGEAAGGVRDALEFIAELKSRPKADVALAGKRIAVIGGGNTAIDAVTQAARLGAERVYLVYRRTRDRMGAYEHEQLLAQQDGGTFVLEAQPVEVIKKDGAVRALRCVKTAPSDQGLMALKGSEFDLEVDLVLRATGQSKLVDFLKRFEGLQLDSRGCVVVDENGRTSLEKVWSGGDCVSGGQEVVNAVAEGKRAANDIHATLQGER
jgi:glutamate synthase (NADPH/NADH) small chain